MTNLEQRLKAAEKLCDEYSNLLIDFSINNKLKGKSIDEFKENSFEIFKDNFLNGNLELKNNFNNDEDTLEYITKMYEKSEIFFYIIELEQKLIDIKKQLHSTFNYFDMNLSKVNNEYHIIGEPLTSAEILNFDYNEALKLNTLETSDLEKLMVDYVNAIIAFDEIPGINLSRITGIDMDDMALRHPLIRKMYNNFILDIIYSKNDYIQIQNIIRKFLQQAKPYADGKYFTKLKDRGIIRNPK